MALMTVGRIPITTNSLEAPRDLLDGVGGRMDTIAAADPSAVEPELTDAKAELEAAKAELENARQNLLASLAPWIPGDYLVVYGILLTAWPRFRGNFPGLLIVAVTSSIVFKIGVDFADGRAPGVKQHLRSIAFRTLIGIFVCVYAAVAVPNSGWYDFKWFVDNEAEVVMTAAGVVIIPVVFVLKGLQKTTSVKLTM